MCGTNQKQRSLEKKTNSETVKREKNGSYFCFCVILPSTSCASSLCNPSCAAAASTTTPAGSAVSITRPMAFLPPAASTHPTATVKTSATPPWPPARFTTRSVALHLPPHHPPAPCISTLSTSHPQHVFSCANPLASDPLPNIRRDLAPDVRT